MKRHRSSYDLALYDAAEVGDVKLLHALVGSGADVNMMTRLYETPLLVAIRENRTEMAAQLLTHGASPEHPLCSGPFALNAAIRFGREDIVEMLTANPQVDVNAMLQNRCDTRLDVTQVLESCRVPPIIGMYSYVAEPPLIVAAAGTRTSARIVELLIHAGARPDLQSSRGDTALQLACCFGFKGTAAALVRAGANVNGAPHRTSPLVYAINCGAEDIVELLLNAGVDVTTPGDLLYIAIGRNHVRIAKALAMAGARGDEEHERNVDPSVYMRRTLFPIIARPQFAFIRGVHARLGADSPIQLLAGFAHILNFIISRSLPCWAIPKEVALPELA
jgi:ankyrin repeat protein